MEYWDRERAFRHQFVILWELAKLDGLPIDIGNQTGVMTLEPRKIDGLAGKEECQEWLVSFAIGDMEEYWKSDHPALWEALLQRLHDQEFERAKKTVLFVYSSMRAMRPIMWDKLFELITKKEEAEQLAERIQDVRIEETRARRVKIRRRRENR